MAPTRVRRLRRSPTKATAKPTTTTVPTAAPITPAISPAVPRLLVGYRAGTGASERDAIHQRAGGTVVKTFLTAPVEVIAIAPGESLDAVAARYAAEPAVAFVEPDRPVHTTVDPVPNDPYFPGHAA